MKKDRKPTPKAKALFDFDGEFGDELSFKVRGRKYFAPNFGHLGFALRINKWTLNLIRSSVHERVDF